MSGNLVETLIGAVVLVVAAAFLTLAYTRADVGEVKGYPLTAKFEKVDGISVGSDVMLGGIKIGSVVGQHLDTETFLAVLDLSLADNIKLPTDSSIKVASDGLLGDKYLSIEPGGELEVLKPGEEIRYTQGSVDLTELIGKAIYSSQGGGGK
jgi:phospholipid/cholesterol/gamma-HCH transport system substrate-binding protein